MILGIIAIVVAVLVFSPGTRELVFNLFSSGDSGVRKIAGKVAPDNIDVMKTEVERAKKLYTKAVTNVTREVALETTAHDKVDQLTADIDKEMASAKTLNGLPTGSPEQKTAREGQLKVRFERITALKADLQIALGELKTVSESATRCRAELKGAQNHIAELEHKVRNSQSVERRAESVELTNDLEAMTSEASVTDSKFAEAERNIADRRARAEALRDIQQGPDDGSAAIDAAVQNKAFEDFQKSLNAVPDATTK